MEKLNRQYYFLLAGAVLIFVASYAVGFVIGKKAGVQEAEKRFEVEKQNLLKTIASLTPVSQPKVEEKVVVVDATKNGNRTSENETAQKAVKTENRTAEAPKTENETKPEKPEKAAQEEKPQEATAVTTPEGNYYIQVGVFRDKSNAVNLINRLKSKGFSAKSVILPSGRYKVIVGYLTKDGARSTYRELKKLGFGGIVKKR